MFAAIWTTISLALATAAVASAAPGCSVVTFEDTAFTVCEAMPGRDNISLALRDEKGAILGTFDRLDRFLAKKGEAIVFATNGGMYHTDRRPVGLYVEDGTQLAPLVTREGPGNFGLLPNGVLCLGESEAAIIESRTFQSSERKCTHATQSGPMLVIDGELHPRFIPDSPSQFVRNGVGVRQDGVLVVAISAHRPLVCQR